MNSNAELHALHEAIFGQELEEIKDPEFVTDILKNEKRDIIMKLTWGEKRRDEYHEEHNIVVQKIDDTGRVNFYNPMGHPEEMEEGTIIEGENMGPKRRVEGSGIESVTSEDFVKFFKERDAVCFFPKEE